MTWICGSIVTGTSSDDIIRGLAGFDQLFGKAGDDLIHGGNGRDIIDGGSGSDELHGDFGWNTFGSTRWLKGSDCHQVRPTSEQLLVRQEE